MTKLKLIGAIALALAMASPAMARVYVPHRYLPTGDHHAGRVMTAQDFDHFDFGIARPTYHSGWGGPYGDGDYPGSVDRNVGPPYVVPY